MSGHPSRDGVSFGLPASRTLAAAAVWRNCGSNACWCRCSPKLIRPETAGILTERDHLLQFENGLLALADETCQAVPWPLVVRYQACRPAVRLNGIANSAVVSQALRPRAQESSQFFNPRH